MTPLHTVSLICGMALAFAYFALFQWAIRFTIDKRQMGRWVFIVGAGLRQLALGAALVGLWWGGVAWPWLLGGLVAGGVLYRYMLLKGWPPR